MKYTVLLILLLICGCTSSSESGQVEADLMSIAMQYHQYVSEVKSPPVDIESLVNFRDPYSSLPGNKDTSDAKTAALASGEYVVHWGYDVSADLSRNASVVLTYHRKVPTEGGFVAYADGSVGRITKEQFAGAKQASEFVSE